MGTEQAASPRPTSAASWSASRRRAAAARAWRPAQTRLPSLLKQDQPVTIRSNRPRVRRCGVARAVYTGARAADAGRGTELRADTIELDDADRQPDGAPQGAHPDDARRRRSEDQAADVDARRSAPPTISCTRTRSGWRLTPRRDGARAPGRPAGGPDRQRASNCSSRKKRTSWSGSRRTATVTTIESESHRARPAPHLHGGGRDLRDDGIAGGGRRRRSRRPARRRWPGSLRFQRAVDNIQTEGSPVTTTNIACPGTSD